MDISIDKHTLIHTQHPQNLNLILRDTLSKYFKKSLMDVECLIENILKSKIHTLSYANDKNTLFKCISFCKY
jgi:hypothetical protein